MCCLYSHQERSSNDEEPQAQQKARQQCVVMLFSRSWWEMKFDSGVSSTAKHSTAWRVTQSGEVQTRVDESAQRSFMCSLCPSLPVFTAAAKGASLPSIKCQADHIDAPPSPQQSLIREQTPTLQRTANGVREAGEELAASLLWLGETSCQSYPSSLLSSMSSLGEARCKKYPYYHFTLS